MSVCRSQLLFFISLYLFGQLFSSVEEPHHTSAFIGPRYSLNTLGSYSLYSTDHFWSKRFKKLPTYNKFRQESYLLYSEFAPITRGSLFFNGGYSSVSESVNGSCKCLRDFEVGLKYQLFTTHLSALTLQASGYVPAGDRKSSVRYGKAGFQAALLYSRLFCGFKRVFWIDSKIGYRYLQRFPSDAAIGLLTLGVQLSYKFYLIGTVDAEWAIGNGNPHFNLNNVTNHPRQGLAKGKLECLFYLNRKVVLSVGAYRHLIGQNVGAGFGGFFGAWILL